MSCAAMSCAGRETGSGGTGWIRVAGEPEASMRRRTSPVPTAPEARIPQQRSR